MTGAELLLRIKLREPAALEAIRKALEHGDGLQAAAARLGVHRNTLGQHARAWPALARLLKRGRLDASQVAHLGGVAGSRARWGK